MWKKMLATLSLMTFLCGTVQPAFAMESGNLIEDALPQTTITDELTIPPTTPGPDPSVPDPQLPVAEEPDDIDTLPSSDEGLLIPTDEADEAEGTPPDAIDLLPPPEDEDWEFDDDFPRVVLAEPDAFWDDAAYQIVVESRLGSGYSVTRVQSLWTLDRQDEYALLDLAPQGYMILRLKTGVPSEYAEIGWSPYASAAGDELYYGGPMGYYESRSDRIVDLLTGTTLESSGLWETSGGTRSYAAFDDRQHEPLLEQAEEIVEEESFQGRSAVHPNPSDPSDMPYGMQSRAELEEVEIVTASSVLGSYPLAIPDSYTDSAIKTYFESKKKAGTDFGDNQRGTCSTIAGAMLIKYFDTTYTILDRTLSTKTVDGERKVYMPRQLVEEMKLRLRQIERDKASYGDDYQDYGLLFCYPNGDPIEEHRLEKWFVEWQCKSGILKDEQITMQGLRKSGQMHKIRITDNNYQLVAANGGHTPEVLMNYYDEALDSEKRGLALAIQDSFYDNGINFVFDEETIMRQALVDPEFFRQLATLVRHVQNSVPC